MAIIGASIGFTFALSLVISPWLNEAIGVPGIFFMMAVLSLMAFLLVRFCIPEPTRESNKTSITLKDFYSILGRIDLGRLNLGIFVLHATQISMFMAVPFSIIETISLPGCTYKTIPNCTKISGRQIAYYLLKWKMPKRDCLMTPKHARWIHY